jgi:hypothetical protein
MTTERDELARDIFLSDNWKAPVELDWEKLQTVQKGDTYAHHIAEGLIAKGYRKPATVTTPEALDALPEESAVALIWNDGTNAVILQKEDGCWWPTRDDRGYTSAMLWDQRAGATLTVLHVGGDR